MPIIDPTAEPPPAQAECAVAQWTRPRPLPPATDPPEPFDPDLLPEAFRAYVTDCAARLSCPPDLVAAPLMVAAGAAVGRAVGIRPKARDSWTEFPNIWGAVIAPPSSMKSPAIEAATGPLHRLECARRDRHSKELSGFEKDRAAYEINLKAAKQRAHKAAMAGGDARDCPMPEEPEEPVERRLIVNAATPEKLVAIHAENPRGLLVLRDELLGWLRGMDRQGRESERALFLEGWTGKNPFRTDTIGRGSDYLPAACLSVFGGIQPGPFREFLQSPEEAGKADGLLQRFSVLVWPERTAYNLNDSHPDREASHRAETALRRLATLNEDALEAGTAPDRDGEPPFLRFAPDAQAAFLEWLERFMNRLPNLKPEAFEGHLGKYRKTLPAFALICELADNPTAGAVSLESWQRAEGWGRYLESHARKVYGAGIHSDRAGAVLVLERLKAEELEAEFSTRDVHRRCWTGLNDLNDIRAALKLLADHGFIRSKAAADTRPGRPSEQWETNPATFEE